MMNTIKANKQWYCFVWLLLFSLPVYTQTDITGRVVDEKNNTPLENAAVYFNNTTIGTYTNQQGNFHFEAIRMLNTELVILMPGYEVLTYKPNPDDVAKKRIVFKLIKTSLPVKRLLLKSPDRKKYLALFRQFFLGITDEAAQSKILNEDDIYFINGGSKIVKAASDVPLVIINKLLGYKINYYLEDFWLDDISGENHFSGYAWYEEMGDKRRWAKNRERCYYGSTLHFYRSLVHHDLYEQGYGIFFLIPVESNAPIVTHAQDSSILIQDSFLLQPAAAQNLLFIDSTNEMYIQSAYQLLVQNNKNPSAKYALIRSGFMDYMEKGVESYVRFKTPVIGINYAGVLGDYSNVEYSGYWLYEKIANMLPYNYEPLSSK